MQSLQGLVLEITNDQLSVYQFNIRNNAASLPCGLSFL
uniref:Uncharacterized protein n=1 Tax=Arundo donax TaxID=35708 RepID=A0A0A8Z8M3_ARUDO